MDAKFVSPKDFVKVTPKLAEELVGFEPADKGFPFVAANGQKAKFVLKNNTSNRPFKIKRAKRYAEKMLRQEWAGQARSRSKTGSGESWIFDKDGQIISCAHRAVGLILAELARKRILANGTSERQELEALGVDLSKPVTIPALIVKGVDNEMADVVDTGDPRTLADVVFRHHDFGKSLVKTEADERKLSTTLSVAIRLVYLRSTGQLVKGGQKLNHDEAMDFLDRHPLLKDCCETVYKIDQEHDYAISNFVSLGYAAGLAYLFACCGVDYAEYVAKDRKIGERSALGQAVKEGLEKAEAFFTSLSLAEGNKDGVGPLIFTLYQVLRDRKMGKIKLDRDTLCTVFVRAYRAYIDDKTVERKAMLRGLLNTAGKTDFVPDITRLGGLDVDKGYLQEAGIIPTETPVEESSGKKGAKKVKGWKVGDTAWFADENRGPIFVRIVNFDTGEEDVATVMDVEEAKKEGEDEAELFEVSVDDLHANRSDVGESEDE